MNRWRIWSRWADRSEDTGAIVNAEDSEGAVERAAMRGVAAGLGRDRRYLGLHAQPVR